VTAGHPTWLETDVTAPTSGQRVDGGTPLPDQVTMGLLPYLTAHALDEDYAQAAARRRQPPHARTRRRIGLAGALALGVFAVLAATAAVQTSQNSASEERERQELIAQVKARRASLDGERSTVARLQAANSELESALLRNASGANGLLSDLRLLELRSGTSAVHGPGVEATVNDARNAQNEREKVLDKDLQKLVNGLWAAGAEAISINGERLTSLSTIRHAGTAITVNLTSLSPPYHVLAIGDPKTLEPRFYDTTSGQTWLDLQRQFGLRLDMRTQNQLRLPAADVPDLRYAKAAERPRGKGLS
jgi:uncharacterized protein YlxW (UPF0749 family)